MSVYLCVLVCWFPFRCFNVARYLHSTALHNINTPSQIKHCTLIGAIGKTLKPYYAACILAGIIALHNNGLMHRYVTPEAVYVTAKGVPMVRHTTPAAS